MSNEYKDWLYDRSEEKKYVMDTREIITRLREHKYVSDSEVANKLESLMNIIDDMTSDHYVDHLDFYMNRCRMLEMTIGRLRRGD